MRSQLARGGLASIIGTAAALVLSLSVVLASPGNPQCRDSNNNLLYTAPTQFPYWYASINTSTYSSTQGVKGNLTTGGIPHTFDSSSQHVALYLSAQEQPAHCTVGHGCWAQVGWTIGQLDECGNVISTGSAVDVFVEMYDDSGPSTACYVATNGAAPSYAAYDVRFTSNLANGRHRWDVYYEIPNSNNIQNLAYGEYNDQTRDLC